MKMGSSLALTERHTAIAACLKNNNRGRRRNFLLTMKW
jgi:hypothetical protein